MSISHFVETLRARWRLASLVIVAALLVALLLSLLLPRQYKATASVLVDMHSPDPLAATVMGNLLNSGYMSTQVDLVQSERVARRAIAALGANRDPALQQAWQAATAGRGDFEAWLAEQMLRKLDVQPTRESGVMSITYTAADPQVAASSANAFMRAYMDTALELRVEPARQYSEFFDDRARLLRQALEQAQNKLAAFQQANGILVSDERIDVENMRYAELTTQLVSTQAAAADASSRQQQASVNAGKMPEILNHPAVAGLNAELARQQIRLGELRERLGEQHPQVQAAEKSLDELRAQIGAETSRISAGMGVNSQINRTREAQLNALLAEQQAKVLRLKNLRDEATNLQRDVDSARAAYDTVLQHARQSGLESRLTQTNVSVLRQATPPPEAASPKLGANLVVAMVLGVVLAVVAVLARELTDRRLRTIDDVVEGLRQPLLVVLPRAATPASRGGDTGLVKARILGGLPNPG